MGENENKGGTQLVRYVCSRCGFVAVREKDDYYCFCPRCGERISEQASWTERVENGQMETVPKWPGADFPASVPVPEVAVTDQSEASPSEDGQEAENKEKRLETDHMFPSAPFSPTVVPELKHIDKLKEQEAGAESKPVSIELMETETAPTPPEDVAGKDSLLEAEMFSSPLLPEGSIRAMVVVPASDLEPLKGRQPAPEDVFPSGDFLESLVRVFDGSSEVESESVSSGLEFRYLTCPACGDTRTVWQDGGKHVPCVQCGTLILVSPSAPDREPPLEAVTGNMQTCSELPSEGSSEKIEPGMEEFAHLVSNQPELLPLVVPPEPEPPASGSAVPPVPPVPPVSPVSLVAPVPPVAPVTSVSSGALAPVEEEDGDDVEEREVTLEIKVTQALLNLLDAPGEAVAEPPAIIPENNLARRESVPMHNISALRCPTQQILVAQDPALAETLPAGEAGEAPAIEPPADEDSFADISRKVSYFGRLFDWFRRSRKPMVEQEEQDVEKFIPELPASAVVELHENDEDAEAGAEEPEEQGEAHGEEAVKEEVVAEIEQEAEEADEEEISEPELSPTAIIVLSQEKRVVRKPQQGYPLLPYLVVVLGICALLGTVTYYLAQYFK